MEYFIHLKGKFPFYLSSGIICAILFFLVVVLNTYNHHLDMQLEDVNTMSLNRWKIIKQVEEIDAVVVYLKNEFDLDTADINQDALIFDALDEIKNNLADSTVRVLSIRDSGGESMHNVEIEMPIKDYSMLVQTFQYLESFRIPKYKISGFSLKRVKPGDLWLSINGNFVMPSL